MKKLTKKILKENKFYNSHDIAKRTGNKIYLSYTGVEYGRFYQSAKWQVVGIGIKTDPDPDSAWYNHGMKTFNVFGRKEKESKFQEALVWIKEKYNLEMTYRDPNGNYHPMGTLEKLKEILEGKNE